MPIIYDEEAGHDRVILNPFLTIDEAVIVLLGKSLRDFPFVHFDDNGEHEDTYELEDYLQLFYDSDDKDLAKKGLKYHEDLLNAVENRELFLFNQRLRAIKLIEWAGQKGIPVSSEHLIFIKNNLAGKRPPKGYWYELRKTEIINALAQLGHEDPAHLPRSRNGIRGIRANVRDIVMKKDHLFHSQGVFRDTWQDMRHEKDRKSVV